MPKPNIHPQWYPEAKVICNGEVVATVGSTKPELQVDLWSGNHPFYTGTQKIVDAEGRVDRFLRKYGFSAEEVKAPVLKEGPALEEVKAAAKKEAAAKKKKK
ncbi:MAG: 50S ribosomal protein L31 [Oscillatoriales cyanobacterium SM2_1_8]|nr:50S ribosomal protein L31 [Oscillatoriales cyanobacterium SM2_1_8]